MLLSLSVRARRPNKSPATSTPFRLGPSNRPLSRSTLGVNHVQVSGTRTVLGALLIVCWIVGLQPSARRRHRVNCRSILAGSGQPERKSRTAGAAGCGLPKFNQVGSLARWQPAAAAFTGRHGPIIGPMIAGGIRKDRRGRGRRAPGTLKAHATSRRDGHAGQRDGHGTAAGPGVATAPAHGSHCHSVA